MSVNVIVKTNYIQQEVFYEENFSIRIIAADAHRCFVQQWKSNV